MEDAQIVLERHEQKLNSLERDILSFREVQTEIRSMNKALIRLNTTKYIKDNSFYGQKKIECP